MIANILKRLPWNQRKIAAVTEALIQPKIPDLSEKSLEDVLMAIHSFRDKRGLKVQLRPKYVLRDEILDQIPPTLR